jgi:uncharacterized protein YjiS (DUF1127 family)
MINIENPQVMKALKLRAEERRPLVQAVIGRVVHLPVAGCRKLAAAGRATAKGIVRAWRRGAMQHELRALSDSMLKDIGVARCQIPALVDQHLYSGDVADVSAVNGLSATP